MSQRESSGDPVYSYVERAYLRMQAGDILTRCLDEGTIEPVQEIVEGLVVAGPRSLTALQEISAESRSRREQVNDDIQQVYSRFVDELSNYGVKLRKYDSVASVKRLTPARFLNLLREQDAIEDTTQVACLQLLKETRKLLKHLFTQLSLLERTEQYLRDWLWGMFYVTAHNYHPKYDGGGTSPDHIL